MMRLVLLGLLLLAPAALAHGAEHSGPGSYEESPDQPFVTGRLMFYAGMSAALGAGLMLLLSPPSHHGGLLRIMAAGAAVQIAALVQLSALEAQYLEVTYSTYWTSAEGVTAALRVVLTLLVAAIAWAAWKRFGPWRTLTRLSVGLVVFLAWMQAALSHAEGRSDLAIALDWIHLVTAAMWLGGLVAFLWFVWRTDPSLEFRRRWSNTAFLLAMAFVATGVANAFQSLGTENLARPAMLWNYAYGRSLLVKVAGVVLVLALAAWNLANVHGKPTWMCFARERHRVLAEAFVGVGVLVVASLLVSSAPLPDDFDPLDYETFEQEVRGANHQGIAYIVPYPQVGETQLMAFDLQNSSTSRTVQWSQVSFVVTHLDSPYNRTYQAEHRGGPLAGSEDVFFPTPGRYLIEVFVATADGQADRMSFGIQV